ELRKRESQLDGIVDRARNRGPRVLKKAKHIETSYGDLENAAQPDNRSLMRLRDWPAADFAQRFWSDRVDAEADRPQPGAVQRVQQAGIETIESRFAFEAQRQSSPTDLVGEGETPVPLLGEERV